MKDFAKSIVCNTKAGNIAADITTDGNTWFVTTSDGKKKEFTSEREAEEYVKKIKSGNSKVGNALKYTNLEEAKKMCKQMNDSLAPDAALRHYRHVYEKDGSYYVMETGEAVAKGMKRVGNSKVENAGKTFSGKYLDIYDNGTVVVKEGYAFGEKFNKNSFDYWVKNEIQSKERILRECKAMKSEFDKNFI